MADRGFVEICEMSSTFCGQILASQDQVELPVIPVVSVDRAVLHRFDTCRGSTEGERNEK